VENQEAEKQFEAYLREHQRLIEKICGIYAFTEPDRQDLFQEIVIQLWKAYPRFKGESSFGTYLYRIALNTAIAGLRKKKDSFKPTNRKNCLTGLMITAVPRPRNNCSNSIIPLVN
jgi:RNA polymerase sigma factor (sigma-70 family)